jgi:ABC-type uncharacterized transport system YnjBCD substrate-binding protein
MNTKRMIAMFATMVCSLAGVFLSENAEQAAVALVIANIWLAAALLAGAKNEQTSKTPTAGRDKAQT